MNQVAGTRPLRVVFSVRNFWYLKYYDRVFHALAELGHRVHIVTERGDGERVAEWVAAMERLSRDQPLISFSWAPRRRVDRWVDLVYWLRRGLDYVRFLDRQFTSTPVLRRRATARAGDRLNAFAARDWPGRAAVARVIERLLHAADTALADVGHFVALLRAEAPDIVVVTPLVALGSDQADVVRAAQHLAIPTAVAVGSWDHLSSKARIRVRPDGVLVWNETQRQEAVAYHGLPANSVMVTGAQCFDQWFDRQPSRQRREFCQQFGFPDDQPLIVYVCSSLFKESPSEAAFVQQWVAAVRSSRHEMLRRASILIRPHPKRGDEWAHVTFPGQAHVIVWPPLGQAPLDAESKADYFDSLFHSAAVVGLNTSAQIEAGLIGRPVYTVLLPEFWDNQEGTLHFHYLLHVGGGLLHAAGTLDEHLAQLAVGLSEPAAAVAKNKAFVESFVRPLGLERPATEVFVEVLQRLSSSKRKRIGVPAWAPVLRWALYPLAAALKGTAPTGWTGREKVSRKLRPRVTEVPSWAWSLRIVTEPLAAFAPRLLGNEKHWREARRRARRRGEHPEGHRTDDGATRSAAPPRRQAANHADHT
jgi:hypothetical protein